MAYISPLEASAYGLASAPVSPEVRAQIIASLDAILVHMREDAKSGITHSRTEIMDQILPILRLLGFTTESSYVVGIQNGIAAEILTPGRIIMCSLTGQSVIAQLTNQIDGVGNHVEYDENRVIASNLDRFIRVVIKS